MVFVYPCIAQVPTLPSWLMDSRSLEDRKWRPMTGCTCCLDTSFKLPEASCTPQTTNIQCNALVKGLYLSMWPTWFIAQTMICYALQ